MPTSNNDANEDDSSGADLGGASPSARPWNPQQQLQPTRASVPSPAASSPPWPALRRARLITSSGRGDAPKHPPLSEQAASGATDGGGAGGCGVNSMTAGEDGGRDFGAAASRIPGPASMLNRQPHLGLPARDPQGTPTGQDYMPQRRRFSGDTGGGAGGVSEARTVPEQPSETSDDQDGVRQPADRHTGGGSTASGVGGYGPRPVGQMRVQAQLREPNSPDPSAVPGLRYRYSGSGETAATAAVPVGTTTDGAYGNGGGVARAANAYTSIRPQALAQPLPPAAAAGALRGTGTSGRYDNRGCGTPHEILRVRPSSSPAEMVAAMVAEEARAAAAAAAAAATGLPEEDMQEDLVEVGGSASAYRGVVGGSGGGSGGLPSQELSRLMAEVDPRDPNSATIVAALRVAANVAAASAAADTGAGSLRRSPTADHGEAPQPPSAALRRGLPAVAAQEQRERSPSGAAAGTSARRGRRNWRTVGNGNGNGAPGLYDNDTVAVTAAAAPSATAVAGRYGQGAQRRAGARSSAPSAPMSSPLPSPPAMPLPSAQEGIPLSLLPPPPPDTRTPLFTPPPRPQPPPPPPMRPPPLPPSSQTSLSLQLPARERVAPARTPSSSALGSPAAGPAPPAPPGPASSVVGSGRPDPTTFPPSHQLLHPQEQYQRLEQKLQEQLMQLQEQERQWLQRQQQQQHHHHQQQKVQQRMGHPGVQDSSPQSPAGQVGPPRPHNQHGSGAGVGAGGTSNGGTGLQLSNGNASGSLRDGSRPTGAEIELFRFASDGPAYPASPPAIAPPPTSGAVAVEPAGGSSGAPPTTERGGGGGGGGVGGSLGTAAAAAAAASEHQRLLVYLQRMCGQLQDVARLSTQHVRHAVALMAPIVVQVQLAVAVGAAPGAFTNPNFAAAAQQQLRNHLPPSNYPQQHHQQQQQQAQLPHSQPSPSEARYQERESHQHPHLPPNYHHHQQQQQQLSQQSPTSLRLVSPQQHQQRPQLPATTPAQPQPTLPQFQHPDHAKQLQQQQQQHWRRQQQQYALPGDRLTNPGAPDRGPSHAGESNIVSPAAACGAAVPCQPSARTATDDDLTGPNGFRNSADGSGAGGVAANRGSGRGAHDPASDPHDVTLPVLPRPDGTSSRAPAEQRSSGDSDESDLVGARTFAATAMARTPAEATGHSGDGGGAPGSGAMTGGASGQAAIVGDVLDAEPHPQGGGAGGGSPPSLLLADVFNSAAAAGAAAKAATDAAGEAVRACKRKRKAADTDVTDCGGGGEYGDGPVADDANGGGGGGGGGNGDRDGGRTAAGAGAAVDIEMVRSGGSSDGSGGGGLTGGQAGERDIGAAGGGGGGGDVDGSGARIHFKKAMRLKLEQ